ncbi:MAG: Spy/CpxP family protein refolding chaperone [Polyangiaceae bacterium]
MRRIQNSSLLVALALALVPVACSQQDQAPESKEQKQEVTQPAEAPKAIDKQKLGKKGFGKFGKDRHGKFGRGNKGPAQLLMKTALKELELTDEQKTKIAALKDEKKEAKGDMKADRESMKTAMVAAAKAGKVDEKAFEAQMTKMKEKQEARTAAQVKLLNGLYAVLTPEQRTTLVTKVKAEMETRQKRMEEMQAKWAERAKDGDKPAGEPDDTKGPHRGMGMKGMGKHGMKGMHGMKGGAFGMLARGLELTEDQQAKVDALAEKNKPEMPDMAAMKAQREAMHKNVLALLDAFAKDGFDASKFDLSPKHKDAGDMMKQHLAQMNEFLAILTPEQRTKLADNLEKGPAMMGRGHGMKRLDRDAPNADDQGADEDDDDMLGGGLDQGLDDIEDDVMGDDQAAE